VLGSFVQTAICLPTVIGVGLLVGFRPTADALEWLAAAGVLLMATLDLVALWLPRQAARCRTDCLSRARLD
jgi:ABC-2 type transport system permease protein